MTNPPTILTNGMLTTGEGCSSIADASGNILIYTDGITVYNSLHQVMANGTGLMGNGSTTQSGVIVKQPLSNNIYFIFTQDDVGGINGMRYSTVDMSLAAGQGSVVSKNVMLQTPSCEKLTSVRHCNGVDIWVISHDVNSTAFRNYLVTSTGVNTTPVISMAGMNNSNGGGTLGSVKASPNGRKLGVALYQDNGFEVFDFDASTGIVSNAITLLSGTPAASAYGCEFSPDGTKFYGARYGVPIIYQWDLCAGSNTAVIASIYTISATGTGALASLQLAPNGKIYCTRSTASLDVIQTPNLAGVLCGFTPSAQSVAPKMCQLGLPNFITSWFNPPPPPFTYTVNCQTVNFQSPATPNMTISGCSANGYSLNSLQWNFGDPFSGSLNTSTVTNPSHSYAALGFYTVSLILNYSCGGGTDTVKQIVHVNQPCISVSSTSITCANLGSATVQATGGIGPFTYTWMPSNQTSSVATGLSPGTYTIRVHDQAINFSYTATTVFTSLVPLTGNVSATSSVACFAASNGTGAVTNISGGSGTQVFNWTNGLASFTNSSVQSLSAGIWTVVVTDALTGCTINQSFLVSQPTQLTTNLSATSPTACINNSITLTANSSGGTSPYTYTWTAGPATNTHAAIQSTAGPIIYTVTSTDANTCVTSNTISVGFIGNPTITVSNVTVCPQKTGTLIANGATSYTWNNLTPGSIYTDAPTSVTEYTVWGTLASCSSSATAFIYLHNSPVPTFTTNSPVCIGKTLLFGATGGASYSWTGPNGFTSLAQAPAVSNANPGHSGVYTVTVTSTPGCTAAISGTMTVNPSPTVAVTGATVCNTQTAILNGLSDPGNTYHWYGPAAYQSTQQNVQISLPGAANAGNYTVVATSVQGCTNSAIAILSVTLMPVLTVNSDQPECEGGSVQLNASGGGTYNWAGPNGFFSVSQAPQISSIPLAANGMYSLTVVLGPCTASSQHSITVFALPQLTVSSNSPVCETKNLQLSAISSTAAVKFLWTGPGYNSLGASPVRPNSIISYAGDYTVTVTDINQCETTKKTNVVVNKNPVISATGATVCLYAPAIIRATGTDSYFWQGPNFFQASVGEATVLSVSAPAQGIYTVTGTAVTGCTTIATATVSAKSLPTPALIVEPGHELCLKENATLTGSGGKKHEWYGPSGYYIQAQTAVVYLNILQTSGTYTLKVTDDFGCTASTTTSLAVKPLPGGSLLGIENSACIPFCSDFTFRPDENAGKVMSQWKIDGAVYNGLSFARCFHEAGDNKITGTLYDSVTTCTNSIDFYISAFPKPVADFTFTPTDPQENDEAVYFTSTSQGDDIRKWDWLLKDDMGNWTAKGEHISHTYSEPGKFPAALLIENIWGCKDTVVKTMVVEEDFVFYVPNAFTPNADDRNEEFKVVGRGINKYEISIYDRWGGLMYQSADVDKGWDGNVNGKPAKYGVYNWVIKASSIRGQIKELTGHVTLYR